MTIQPITPNPSGAKQSVWTRRRVTVGGIALAGVVGLGAVGAIAASAAPSASPSAAAASGAPTPPAPGKGPAGAAHTPHIGGTVLTVSGSSFTVKDHDGFTRSVTVASSAKVTDSGKTASVSAIDVGDHVEATGTVDSDHTTLDATAVMLGTPPKPAAGAEGGPAGGPKAGPDGKAPAAPTPPTGKAPKAPTGTAPSGAPTPSASSSS